MSGSAASATPPRPPSVLCYGRFIDRRAVQALLISLTPYTPKTFPPPEPIHPSLPPLAANVQAALIDEHDHSLYDPGMWTRLGAEWAIALCDLLIAGDIQGAARLQVDAKSNARPSCYLVPSLCMALPPQIKSDDDDAYEKKLRMLVEATCSRSSDLVDDTYRRAMVEIILYEKFTAQRLWVYDDRTVAELLDETFGHISKDALPPDREEDYQQIRKFIFAHLPVHYSGEEPTGLEFQSHVYDIIRWMVYANNSNKMLNMVMSVGPGRSRYKALSCTGVCWASSNLCGYIDNKFSIVVDGKDVWELIVYLNKKYNMPGC